VDCGSHAEVSLNEGNLLSACLDHDLESRLSPTWLKIHRKPVVHSGNPALASELRRWFGPADEEQPPA
jgi:hypothetical protein